MENYVFDSNTKLVVVYYNGGNYPFCSGFPLMSPSLDWRVSWIKSTSNSSTETRGGWMVLSIDIRRLTQPGVCGSAGWSLWTTTTLEPCSRSLVSTVLEERLSWTLRWSDMLNIFNKVWSDPGTTKRSGH